MKGFWLTVVLAIALLVNTSCAVLVSPAGQFAVMMAILVGKQAAQTAAYQTIEACMDEVVRPLIRKAMGLKEPGKVGGVDLVANDPLRGKMRGKFTFTRTSPLPQKAKEMGEIDLVRDSVSSEWLYDPAYLRLMKSALGADVITIQQAN